MAAASGVVRPPADLESLDYDTAEHDSVMARNALEPTARTALNFRLSMLKVALMLLTGISVGSLAFFIVFLAELMTDWKFGASDAHWYRGEYAIAWLVLMGFVGLMGLAAALLTLWAPNAAGSGIPLVKAYLNGNNKPGVLYFRTLVAKVLGISLCVAAGLPVGREGPMVHAGAIAAWYSAKLLSIGLHGKLGHEDIGIDNDFDRRNFVSMGAGARGRNRATWDACAISMYTDSAGTALIPRLGRT